MPITSQNLYIGKRLIPASTRYKECAWVLNHDVPRTMVRVLFSDGAIVEMAIDHLQEHFAENTQWEKYVDLAIENNVPIMSLYEQIEVRIHALSKAKLLAHDLVTIIPNKEPK